MFVQRSRLKGLCRLIILSAENYEREGRKGEGSHVTQICAVLATADLEVSEKIMYQCFQAYVCETQSLFFFFCGESKHRVSFKNDSRASEQLNLVHRLNSVRVFDDKAVAPRTTFSYWYVCMYGFV